ncbi:MAG: helix-hairpin-helix domain-containing protein [Gammaproteobacteria bacterium]|nr:helix-hairpin-helix domain-containing protein [Gammaproteobacteria bacterium]
MLVLTSTAFAAPVNINTADAQTLAENIKGIGPKKAQAIVTYRRENGSFKSIHDLAKVKGIGEKLVARNKSDLLLSDVAVKQTKK